MDISTILENLRVVVSSEGEGGSSEVNAKADDGAVIGKRSEVKEKLDTLSGFVEIAGPGARKEAVVANSFRTLRSAWKWILLQEEIKTDRMNTSFGDNADENAVSLLSLREALLRAINSLTPGFPDVVDIEVVADLIMTFLTLKLTGGDEEVSESMKIEALKAIRNICIRCERNREFLTNLKLDEDVEPDPNEDSDRGSFVAVFCSWAKNGNLSPILIRYWCEALAAFVSNDDRRVGLTPNRAEERKKRLSKNGGLATLVGFLSNFHDSRQLNPIVCAVTVMASNRELCDVILEAGVFGQGSALEIILQNYTNIERDRLVVNAISCIKNLTVTPAFQEVLKKSFIVKNILRAAIRMKGKAVLLEVIISALATITIHSPTAVTQLLKENGLDTIFELMSTHQDNLPLVKSFCLILENVVAYGGDIGKNTLIENEREVLLKNLINTYPELIDTFLKPTIRELGL